MGDLAVEHSGFKSADCRRHRRETLSPLFEWQGDSLRVQRLFEALYVKPVEGECANIICVSDFREVACNEIHVDRLAWRRANETLLRPYRIRHAVVIGPRTHPGFWNPEKGQNRAAIVGEIEDAGGQVARFGQVEASIARPPV